MSQAGTSVGPNFFVIGAQRAATTRLCALLDLHPDVTIPTKEPMYFQSETDMAAKAQWYRGLFAGTEGIVARGDGSTYYSMCGLYPGTAHRIHEYDPDARIIYIVRHPLRRIESAWAQLLSVGDANSFTGFERTLSETNLLLDPSLYWRQLSEYRSFFPDEQIFVEFFEDFIIDEKMTVDRCLAFLKLSPLRSIDITDSERRNASAKKRQRVPIIDAVRLVRGYERVKHLIPQPLKTLFSDVITMRVPATIDWSPKAREWALDQLRDDTTRFLRHVGRSPSYWLMR